MPAERAPKNTAHKIQGEPTTVRPFCLHEALREALGILRRDPELDMHIPKAVRALLGLRAGQQFVFVAKGDTISPVPKRELRKLRGLLRGARVDDIRDKRDRP